MNCRDEARDVRTKPGADRGAKCKHGHSHRAPVGGKVVSDNGIASWRASSLTDTNAHTGQKQVEIAARVPRNRRHK